MGPAIVRPRLSEQLDYEGEFVAVIGQGGRGHPARPGAGPCDGHTPCSMTRPCATTSSRPRNGRWARTSDGTGAFGPYLVTDDELPPGCEGLRLQTRLNGAVVQDASTNDLVFSVATLISVLSQAMTLEPGDIIVTGTPAGVGLARKPPLWMKPGDVCEVELEGLGVLRNPVADQGDALTTLLTSLHDSLAAPTSGQAAP